VASLNSRKHEDVRKVLPASPIQLSRIFLAFEAQPGWAKKARKENKFTLENTDLKKITQWLLKRNCAF
jgi:hypothetical protein